MVMKWIQIPLHLFKVITMKEIASQQIAGGNVQTAAFKKYESFLSVTQKYGKGGCRVRFTL